MKKTNKKAYVFGKKNYGNEIVLMRFNMANLAFDEIKINGTREEKINRLMKWYNKEDATDMTERSLKGWIVGMVE